MISTSTDIGASASTSTTTTTSTLRKRPCRVAKGIDCKKGKRARPSVAAASALKGAAKKARAGSAGSDSSSTAGSDSSSTAAAPRRSARLRSHDKQGEKFHSSPSDVGTGRAGEALLDREARSAVRRGLSFDDVSSSCTSYFSCRADKAFREAMLMPEKKEESSALPAKEASTENFPSALLHEVNQRGLGFATASSVAASQRAPIASVKTSEMLGGDGISFVDAYGPEYYTWLFNREMIHLPDLYIKHQQRVTEALRVRLIDWMGDLMEEMGFSRITLFIAVDLLDRSLGKLKMASEKEFHLCGCACLFIASKFEEVHAVSPRTLIKFLGEDAKVSDITSMEKDILQAVNFRVLTVTPAHFQSRQFEAAGSDKRQIHLTDYLLELGLQDYGLVGVKSSVKAASALLLARLTLAPRAKGPEHWARVWPAHVRDATGYSPMDLKACVQRLHALQSTAEDNHLALGLRERYSTCKRMGVANAVCLNEDDLSFEHSSL